MIMYLASCLESNKADPGTRQAHLHRETAAPGARRLWRADAGGAAALSTRSDRIRSSVAEYEVKWYGTVRLVRSTERARDLQIDVSSRELVPPVQHDRMNVMAMMLKSETFPNRTCYLKMVIQSVPSIM